jgi:predicted NUDIX family NTP pyrophosphohydrolase
LMYRIHDGELQMLLAHPGGPFFKNKYDGAWTIPKGEIEPGEDPLAAARREFEEELGHPVSGAFIELAPVRQASGKVVHAWAVEADFDPATLNSGTFTMEWPPRSGRQQQFVEVDRVGWFTIDEAKRKINKAQIALIDELNSR